jgi:hypothetical protein
MSPRSETFDRGKNPYQAFVKIKNARDSLVHLSEKKVDRYWSIDVAFAKVAVLTVVELIGKVSEFLAADTRKAVPPFWLSHPGDDGLFKVRRTLELKLPQVV